MKYSKDINNMEQNLSPKSRHKISNPYKKTNNRSTNSKYIPSSMKKSINQVRDYTIDSDNNKNLFYSEEENKNYHNLANDIRIQNKILEEYQKWVKTLFSVINNNKINNEFNNIYDDIGTPIQENLEHIEKLKEENFKIKTLIINQKLNNENSEKKLEKKQLTQNMVIKEFNEKEKNHEEKIKKEKNQLAENVQILANELDDLSEYNKQLNDKIMNDEKLKKIYEMINLRNQLKEENKLYKKIMVFKNRKNYLDLKETLQSNDSTIDFNEKKNNKKLFKNLNDNSNNIKKDYGNIGPITGYGEYQLEKEENIHTTGSIFCGL
jgi:hypothetical protein